jgi:hypothetical protein
LFSIEGRQKASCDLKFCVEQIETMPPRRFQERPMPDPSVKREMTELHARFDAMETSQRRIVYTGDISQAEIENAARSKEEFVAKDFAEEHLFKFVARIGPEKKWTSRCRKENLMLRSC